MTLQNEAFIDVILKSFQIKHTFLSAAGRHILPIIASHTEPAAQDMDTQAVMVQVQLALLECTCTQCISIFQLYAGDLHPVQMEELVEGLTTVHAELDGVATDVQQVQLSTLTL